jgi:hypothetical protein
MLTPKRDFLIEMAQRLTRERGITHPPDLWKLSDLEIELFLETYLWSFVRRASLKYLE